MHAAARLWGQTSRSRMDGVRMYSSQAREPVLDALPLQVHELERVASLSLLGLSAEADVRSTCSTKVLFLILGAVVHVVDDGHGRLCSRTAGQPSGVLRYALPRVRKISPMDCAAAAAAHCIWWCYDYCSQVAPPPPVGFQLALPSSPVGPKCCC